MGIGQIGACRLLDSFWTRLMDSSNALRTRILLHSGFESLLLEHGQREHS